MPGTGRIVLGLVAFGLIGQATLVNAYEYPPDERAPFLASCNANCLQIAPQADAQQKCQAFCECNFDGITATVPYQDFFEFGAAIKMKSSPRPELLSKITAPVAACRLKVMK